MLQNVTYKRCPQQRPSSQGLACITAVTALALGVAGTAEADGHLAAQFGVEIPQVTVNFGMAPFGDHVIYSAAMAQGWYDEAGINIGPRNFATIAYDQITPLLLNGDFDFTSQYGPNQIQVITNAPEIQQVTFSDTYVGLFILAPPGTEYKTMAGLVADGMSFEDAMIEVMAQLKGKSFAIDDTGSHRAFVDTVFDLGGVGPSDIGQLLTVEDARMLLLAKGGQIDFAKPLGGAQTVELLLDGWYPILGAEDVIAGLPAGDPRGVTSIGHTGMGSTLTYWNENSDTVLRMAGVMFRVIDQIKADIETGSDNALKHILPVLESAAAVDIGMEGLRKIYGVVDPMKSFEEQSEYWIEEDNPFYFANVYEPQIEALVEGGVIPKEKQIDAVDAFLGDDVYKALLAEKEAYDVLISQAGNLTGAAAELAELAAVHYENRNYLDAHRFLKAAIDG